MSFPPFVGEVEVLSLRGHLLGKLSALRKAGDVSGPSLRVDGRGSRDVRQCTVTRGVAHGTLASLQYSAGNTLLVAAISLTLGPTETSHPDRGRLSVHVSSPLVEDVAPCRVIEAFASEILASCFDLGQLVVVPGEACWVLTIDLVITAADGGLRAACVHAAALLLNGFNLPRTKLPNDTYTAPLALKLSGLPVCFTAGFVFDGELMLADATATEEIVCDQQVSVVLDASKLGGEPSLIFAGHHGGNPLSSSVMLQVVKSAAAAMPAASPWIK